MANTLHQLCMVQWVLIDVDATPDAVVVFINRDNANSGPFSRQMLLEMLRGPWFANDSRFTLGFTVLASFVDFKRAISLFEAIKDSRETICIRHLLYAKERGLAAPV